MGQQSVCWFVQLHHQPADWRRVDGCVSSARTRFAGGEHRQRMWSDPAIRQFGKNSPKVQSTRTASGGDSGQRVRWPRTTPKHRDRRVLSNQLWGDLPCWGEAHRPPEVRSSVCSTHCRQQRSPKLELPQIPHHTRWQSHQLFVHAGPHESTFHQSGRICIDRHELIAATA